MIDHAESKPESSRMLVIHRVPHTLCEKHTDMSEVKNTIEEMKVAAGELVDRVKELIKDGSAKRVSIKKGDHVYMEIPLSYGVGGAMATIWLTPGK